MSEQRKDKSRGFSLLEMMTVITIILILATFSEPYFLTVIVHGREAVLREDLFTLRTQIDRLPTTTRAAPPLWKSWWKRNTWVPSPPTPLPAPIKPGYWTCRMPTSRSMAPTRKESRTSIAALLTRR